MRASEIRELLKWITEDVISFGGGLPDPSIFPSSEIADIVKDILASKPDKALQYGTTEGLIELRREISRFMEGRGVRCSAENILITVGSQEALDLIGRVLIDAGDYIVTESPTYLAALQAFRVYGPRIVGIPIDDGGILVDKLEAQIKSMRDSRDKLKLIYVIPTGHNPTGITMSIERRKQLMELASRHDLLIVEDDPYSYLTFIGEPPPSLKSMDNEGRVIYVSTFSKLIAPGLRLGWVVANEELIHWLTLAKQAVDLHTPTLTQYIAHEMLRRGLVERNVPRIRELYRGKRELMLEALEASMPHGVTWTKPTAGMFIWLTVPGVDTEELLEIAIRKYRVAYVPGRSFYPDGDVRNNMRLNFTYPTQSQIREGISRLAEAIRNAIR